MASSKRLVSIIVLAENAPIERINDCLNSITNQTHKNYEVLISHFQRTDINELRTRWNSIPNLYWVECTEGFQMLERGLQQATGEVVFYKTCNPIVWYPRHIEHHLDLFEWDNKAKWSFSHLEFHNIKESQQPVNTIGWRFEKSPRIESVILDEICHLTEITPNWRSCLASLDGGKSATFMPGLILDSLRKQYRVAIPEEITVMQWVDPTPPRVELGKPGGDNNVEEEVYEDSNGQLGVRVQYPTLVGSDEWSEHNRLIYERLSEIDRNNIKSIAVKRTMGMGDVILVEPVVRALKQKYPNAQITLFTSKNRGGSAIAQFFKSKLHAVVEIGDDNIVNDTLYGQKGYDIRIDLDLSYESRKNINYIDAYFQVAGFKDEIQEVDGMLTVVNPISEDQKIPELEFFEPSLVEGKYVAVELGGSGWGGKEWDIQKWSVILKKLVEDGYKIAFVSSQRILPPDTIPIEKLAFNTENNFTIMMNFLRHCEFYVGADNGPMHIAAGFGKKCFVVAGTALPKYTTKNPKVYGVSKYGLDCLHCKGRQYFNKTNEGGITFVTKCDNKNEYECMKNLELDYVQKEFENFLSL